MTDPISFPIRADRVARILESKKSELRTLMRMAGGDAATFYAGADLSEVDLRGQNVRALNFDDSDLTDVKVDERTQIDGRAFLNPSLRVDFLTIARNAAEIRLTKEDWLNYSFALSVGLSPRFRHSREEISFHIVEKNISERAIETHAFRLRLTAVGIQELRKIKAMLSFLELACFARFLADAPLPSELMFEQFDHWRQNRDPAGVQRNKEQVPYYHSPEHFMLIDAPDFLIFLSKAGRLDKKTTSAAIRKYAALVDGLVGSPLLRDFRTMGQTGG